MADRLGMDAKNIPMEYFLLAQAQRGSLSRRVPVTDLSPSDGLRQPVSTPGVPKIANLDRWWLPWLLLVIAVAYYGSYALSGLDLGGEGGTTAVYAQRLLEGQR